MTRVALAACAAAAVPTLFASAALARPRATPTLNGTVGPGYTISLTMNGRRVTTLRAGTYRVTVADKASIHNFTLEREKGGTFEKDVTTPSFVGTKTMTLKLGAGSWKYYCKVHPTTMSGDFTVR